MGPGEQRQVVNPGQCLPEPEDCLGQLLDGGVEAERAAVSFYTRFVDDAFENLSARPLKENVDVVVVADVHERVTTVREPDPTDSGLGHVDGESVSVRKLEVRAQHQGVVRAPGESHFGTETLAEELLHRVDIERHASVRREPSTDTRAMPLEKSASSWRFWRW